MNKGAQTKLIFFMGILLLFSLSFVISAPEDPQEIAKEYTPSTTKICQDGKCTLTLYSGTRFIYEDNQWKKTEEARSFKNSNIKCIVRSDGINFVECLDYNETSRTVKYSRTDLKTNIPLRKYTINKSGDRVYDSNFETSFNFNTVSQYNLIIKANPNEIIEFGEHSTELILQDADTENLDDAEVYQTQPNTNYGGGTEFGAGYWPGDSIFRTYIKFNITDIPSGKIIDNATFQFKADINNAADDRNYSIHHVMSGFSEETLTWNNQPCGTAFNTAANCNLTASSKVFVPSGQKGYIYWDATDIIKRSYSGGNKSSSFAFKSHEEVAVAHDLRGRSKEWGTASQRPILNITYSEGITNNPPVINLQAPIDNLEFTPGSTEFIYNVSDPEGDIVENCSLWLNKNETGFELDQTDSSITQTINQSFTKILAKGNYSWKVDCYDNNTNEGVSEIRNIEVTGVNNPPAIDVPVISPDPAYTDSQLNCSTIAYDIDLNSIIIEVKWYNDSVYTAYENITTINGTMVSSLLPLSIQNKDEEWNCSVSAFDGQNTSSLESDVITILNTVPTHSDPLLQASTIYNTTSDDLTCYNQSTLDLDNDAVVNIYSWYVNNNPLAVLSSPFEINADDYSGSNNDGTIYGAISTAGKYGNALSFDGNDNYVDFGNSAGLNQNFNALTVEAWVKPGTRASGVINPMILSKYYAWNLHINYNNNGFVFAFNDGGGWSTDSVVYSAALSTDNWYHVVGRYDGSTCKIFVNGNEAASSSCNGNIITNANTIKIGRWGTSNGEWFNGSMDEVKIYSRALSSNEISEHYNLNYNKIVSQETSVSDVWKCKVTPNDGSTDGSLLESNTLTIQPNVYDITFNITEGEYGSSLTGAMIACDNGWSVSSTDANPYGPVKFYEGGYNCEFEKLSPAYYNKTKVFIVDNNKQLDIVMSFKKQLTIQEHNWLEAIYNCLYEGDCYALNLLEEINTTTNNLWSEFKPTDESVVIQEDILSNILSSTQNITINYTIKAPPKAGYSTGDYAPMRIAFWFLDTTNNESCLDQDKVTTDTNRVEKSYCIPLIAETLAIVNQEVDFIVELRPNLPEGTYQIVRDIEIDPNEVWIKYGQEIIDKVKVSESNNNPNIFLIKQEISQPEENFEDLTPKIQVQKSSGLTYITNSAGDNDNSVESAVENVQRLLSGSQIVSIIGMICGLLTIVIVCFTIYKIKN